MKSTLIALFRIFNIIYLEENVNMQTFASILGLSFLIALILAIIFGVKWFKQREDKSGEDYKQNKKKTIISIIVMVVLFIGSGMAQSAANKQEAEAQAAAQRAKDKKNYKSEKEDFIDDYTNAGSLVEDLSSKEGEEWEDAIDASDDDFDVDATIEDIEENNSEDIDKVEDAIDSLHEADQEIQNNTAAPKKDKETIHAAYLDLKHFASHATSLSGSYNDFVDEHNELDRKITDRIEELEDL